MNYTGQIGSSTSFDNSCFLGSWLTLYYWHFALASILGPAYLFLVSFQSRFTFRALDVLVISILCCLLLVLPWLELRRLQGFPHLAGLLPYWPKVCSSGCLLDGFTIGVGPHE